MSLLKFHLINKWYFNYWDNISKVCSDKTRINNTVIDRLEILILPIIMYVHHACFENYEILYFVFLQKIKKVFHALSYLFDIKMYENTLYDILSHNLLYPAMPVILTENVSKHSPIYVRLMHFKWILSLKENGLNITTLIFAQSNITFTDTNEKATELSV